MREHTVPPGVGKRDGIGFARAMRRIVLANETDWEGWRKATRSLVMAGVAPEDVRWAVRSHDEEGDPSAGRAPAASVCRDALVSLASLAIQAREPERFDLLYRLVWRANAGESVLEMTTIRICGVPRASLSRSAPRRTGCAPCCAICR